MSSEVCQLCLEALTPLAEQCAKAQETDSPLFLATRHFLKVRCLGAVIARGGGGGLPSGGSAGTFIHEEIDPALLALGWKRQVLNATPEQFSISG